MTRKIDEWMEEDSPHWESEGKKRKRKGEIFPHVHRKTNYWPFLLIDFKSSFRSLIITTPDHHQRYHHVDALFWHGSWQKVCSI